MTAYRAYTLHTSSARIGLIMQQNVHAYNAQNMSQKVMCTVTKVSRVLLNGLDNVQHSDFFTMAGTELRGHELKV